MARLLLLLLLAASLGVGCVHRTEVEKEDLKWRRIIAKEEQQAYFARCTRSGGIVWGEGQPGLYTKFKYSCVSKDSVRRALNGYD